MSSAGDVNGDGFDDLLIGAPSADTSGNGKLLAGESYVIFGGASLPETIDLASLGAAGFRLFGADAGDGSGYSVSSAGDVNGDGFDDVLIGAYHAGAAGNGKSSAGDSYVIFGGASLPATIDLASLGAAAITIFGADAGDESGRRVSSAGDVNGDGFDDMLIGANYADASGNGKSSAGESYVIFGGDFTLAVTHAGTAAGETLTGNAAANVMIGGRGNDILIGNGGSDVLRGGEGNDTLAVSDLAFKRIVGGNGFDTLRLDGSGLSLNLTTLADNRLLGIEQIDLTGSGNNTLTLDLPEVLNLSDESNTLLVRRNAGDTVNIGTGWTQAANQVISGDTFEVFTQGQATLKVQAVTASNTLSATIVGNDLVIEDTDGTGKNNVLSISRSGSNLVITDANEPFGSAIAGAVLSNSNKTITVPVSALGATGKIIFKTQGGSDSLSVDLSTDLGFDVDYEGGSGTSDSLTLAADTVTSVTHTFTNANDGSVTIVDGGTRVITYTGLEPITDNLIATDRVFTFNFGAETITLTDTGGADGKMNIDSTLSESVMFANPSGSLTINTNGGDTVSINSLDNAFAAAVTLNGTNPSNTFRITAAERFPNATDLTVSGTAVFDLNGFAETIDALAGSGTVDNTAAGTATLTVGSNGGTSPTSPV